MECPGCKQPNPPGVAHCAACGTSLQHPPPGFASGREGERRQLTVMFCDLVESTALGQQLDPEDLREVLAAYQNTCARVIASFEGHLAQLRGDGVLAYFSYPRAHEDDAERAVRTGLGIVSALAEVNPRLERERGVRLRVRVAIHTGPVVLAEVSEASGGEVIALGHTVNLAARLEGVAAPDTVVMSAETLRLVRGLFVTEDLGSFRMKGIAAPVAVHRAVRPSGIQSRLDLAIASGLTPLIGRQPELDLLADRWHRVREGSGEVVLIRGEAGMGKSRLVRAFRERLIEERHSWLECRGSPHHPHSALHPVIDLLRQGLRFTERGSAEDKTLWIERALDLADIDRETVVPLLADLLSIPLSGRYAPLELSAESRRRKTLEALVAWLMALARLQPTVMIVEDLHWVDPSSLELLEGVIARAAEAPILVLATCRPSFGPASAVAADASLIDVEPLTRRETLAMIEAVARDAPLSDRTLFQLASKSDGVPLFVEELTKSVLEADSEAEPTVPSTLQDSLMARLDRLGPVKEIAQLAAVLGRDFSYPMLAAASGQGGDVLAAALHRLEVSELVYRRGVIPDATFTFKHALIQEVAYESLLKQTRRSWHARLTDVFERRFPERVASHPEEAARHCESGGLIEKAIEYYQRAGGLATERSAHDEAIGHLNRANDLLGQLPPGRERDEQELMIQITLGASLGASKGWGTEEAERAYGRARQLCERIGETPQLFPALRGLTAFYTSHAELDTSLDLCARLLRLAEQGNDPSQLLLAHHQLGVTHLLRGEPVVAQGHFERAVAHYDPSQHRSLAAAYQADPGVFVRIWMAWTLWIIGLPDQALVRAREGVEIARRNAHPFSLGYALLWTAVVHLWRRERDGARELAEEAIEVGTAQDFAFVLAGGRLICAACAGSVEDFGQALSDFGKAGSTGAGRPHTLGAIASGLADAGRYGEAEAFVDAALEFSKKTSQRYWDAELLRLKGELLHREPSTLDEAEHWLRLALDLARKQRARMLELRAGVSLARLLRGREPRTDTLGFVAPVYDAFTEGFATADLADAKALINSLSSDTGPSPASA